MHFSYNAEMLVGRLIDQKALEQFLSDMAAFGLMCSENRRIEDTLLNPHVADDKKRVLLDTVVAPFFGKHFSALLTRLHQNGDLPFYSHIAGHVQTEVQRRYGACFAEVSSVIPLTEQQMKRISMHLEKLCGHRIYASNIISRDLIGGFVVTIEGRRIDLSIRGDLLKMKTAVLGGDNGHR